MSRTGLLFRIREYSDNLQASGEAQLMLAAELSSARIERFDLATNTAGGRHAFGVQ
jgi:hypothetical protein